MPKEVRSVTRREIKVLMKEHTDRMKKNIYKLVKTKGITYTELGYRIGKDRFYIDYIMNHPCPNPRIENVLIIAEALGVPYTSLFRK